MGRIVVPCPLTWHFAAQAAIRRQRIGVAAGAATVLSPTSMDMGPLSGHSDTIALKLRWGAVNGRHLLAAPLRKFLACEHFDTPSARGNSVPSRWESCSQPLGIVFPAAGNRIPKPGGNTIVLGNDCHSPWQYDCQPRVMRLPALGNTIASPWQCDCRPLAMRLPALGNRMRVYQNAHKRGICGMTPLGGGCIKMKMFERQWAA